MFQDVPPTSPFQKYLGAWAGSREEEFLLPNLGVPFTPRGNLNTEKEGPDTRLKVQRESLYFLSTTWLTF